MIVAHKMEYFEYISCYILEEIYFKSTNFNISHTFSAADRLFPFCPSLESK